MKTRFTALLSVFLWSCLIHAQTPAPQAGESAEDRAKANVEQFKIRHWQNSRRFSDARCYWTACLTGMERFVGQDEDGKYCELEYLKVENGILYEYPASMTSTLYPFWVSYDFTGYTGSNANIGTVWWPKSSGHESTHFEEYETPFRDELAKSDPARYAKLYPEVSAQHYGMASHWRSVYLDEYGSPNQAPRAYEADLLIFGPDHRPAYFIHSWQRAWTGWTPRRRICKFESPAPAFVK